MSDVAASSGFSPDAPPRAKFCTRCGAAASGGAFCTQCGAAFEGSSAQAQPALPSPVPSLTCQYCGGDGHWLSEEEVFCLYCRWLRPIAPDYVLPVDVYMWALDAQAMNTLAGIGPVSAAARSLSGHIGRPWLEASVNGLRLGPDQLPDIFNTAIMAARMIGLARMPEIYVSGDQMWDALTLGDETNAFIVLGSVLTTFRDEDLLYLLGREMGHVAAGHALWKTVTYMLSGRQSAGRSVMGDGLMKFLNPTKLVESAVDAPLMAWARHAAITADRAGALCVGDHEVAKRVAIQWGLHSFPLYSRLNHEALERQIEESESQAVQAAEWAMSSTPFLARRLRLMREFFASESYRSHRATLAYWAVDRPNHLSAERQAQAAVSAPSAEPASGPFVRVRCVACGEGLRIPQSSLEGRQELRVRCANPACGKVLTLTAPSARRDGQPQGPPSDGPKGPPLDRAAPPAQIAEPAPAVAGGLAQPASDAAPTPAPDVPDDAPPPSEAPTLASADAEPSTTPAPDAPRPLRLTCPKCAVKMDVARQALVGEGELFVRCPAEDCRQVVKLTRKAPLADPTGAVREESRIRAEREVTRDPAIDGYQDPSIVSPPEMSPEPPAKASIEPPQGSPDMDQTTIERAPLAPPRPAMLRLGCPVCQKAMEVPLEAVHGDGDAYIRCPTATCRQIVKIKRRARQQAPLTPTIEQMSGDG